MVVAATDFKQGLNTMRLVFSPKTVLISNVTRPGKKLAKKLSRKAVPVQYCLEAVDLGVDATGGGRRTVRKSGQRTASAARRAARLL
eukprot:1284166-Pyramimonas_sp.AAC.1